MATQHRIYYSLRIVDFGKSYDKACVEIEHGLLSPDTKPRVLFLEKDDVLNLSLAAAPRHATKIELHRMYMAGFMAGKQYPNLAEHVVSNQLFESYYNEMFSRKEQEFDAPEVPNL